MSTSIRDWSDESLAAVAEVLKQLVDETRNGHAAAAVWEQAAVVMAELARRECHRKAPEVLR